jgi:hypothetical protein
MPEKPKTLFRFFGNVDYALDCLEENKLTIPRVDQLNDPFDPNLFIHGDDSWRKAASDFKKSEEKMRDEVLKSTFIGCFSMPIEDSNPQNNLYMWGHYANGHRGAVIEFDFEKLEESLPELEDRGLTEKIRFKPVEYGQPVLLNQHDLEEFFKAEGSRIMAENLERNLYIKSPNWEPESEYRFIDKDESTNRKIKKYDLLKKTIRSVYCGLRLIDKDRERFKTAAKAFQNNIPVYGAKKVFGKLELEFEEIK